MRRISTLLCPCVAAVFLLSTPALAQDAQIQAPSHSAQPRNAAKVQELQRIIAEQQRQLDAQQEQLEAQKKMLQELQQQVQGLAECAPPPQAPQTTQQAMEPAQAHEAAKHTATSAEKEEREWEEAMFEKLLRDPRTWPEGMKRPDGWISVPGRKTDVRFGGFVQVNFIHDFQNAGFPYGEFITSQIAVPTDDTSNTEFDPRTSRLTFESRTPGARDSYYNTFFSIDFAGNAGESLIQPRLRQAYLSGIGLFSGAAFTVGQVWTTFLDLSVWPDIFDLEGPNAMTGLRQVLVRYAFTLDEEKHLIADVALEQPETGVQNGNGLRNLPDAVARIRWQQDWGHLTGALLGRQLGRTARCTKTQSSKMDQYNG